MTFCPECAEREFRSGYPTTSATGGVKRGEQTIVASGEFKDGAQPPDDGDSVTLEGPDGVARPWKISHTVEIPYVGLAIHVEPLESG